jgi:RsmE family RNA methyltransferase
MNLILLEASEISPEGLAVLRDERAVHVHEVLRAQAGGRLRAGIVDGPLGEVSVIQSLPHELVLDCTPLASAPVPPRPEVDVLLALPRPKVLGRLLRSLACLGVGRVLLTHAARVEPYYFDAHQLAPDYLGARLREGLSQAKDTRLPVVSVHRSFRRLLEDELDALCPVGPRLVADLVPAAPRLSEACRPRPGERVLVALGPEGGWVDFERELFLARGFVTFGMGERVLRSDVACIAALGLAHEALFTR